jgi:hypothetical protein
LIARSRTSKGEIKMPSAAGKVLKFVALVVIAYALISILSGLSSIASIAERFVSGSWMYVFGTLLCAISFLIAYPIWQVMKLPRAPMPPEQMSGTEHDDYQAWLLQHLKNHSDPTIAVAALRDGVRPALEKLNAKADTLVFAAASQVFIETALSQNGRLDGLLVLARQVRLVWSVASLYELRPMPNRLWYLYSNIAMASILSTNIEDMDLDEMVKPLVAAVLPAAAGAIPGLQTIASIAVSSLMDGTANALLTLRIGGLTKEYALPLCRPQPAEARRRATVQAYSMLSRVTSDNVGKVLPVFVGIAKGTLKATVGKAWDGAVRGANVATDGVGAAATFTGEKIAIAAEKAVDVAGSTAKVVSDASRKAVDQTAKASGYVSEKVGAAASATGETLGSAGMAFKGAVVDGSDVLAQKARASAVVVKDVSVDVGQRVASISKTAASGIASMGGKTSDKLGNGLSSIKSSVTKAFKHGGPDSNQMTDTGEDPTKSSIG